jgi:Ethanolamine utilization protein EutJ (predicted chaperonin)
MAEVARVQQATNQNLPALQKPPRVGATIALLVLIALAGIGVVAYLATERAHERAARTVVRPTATVLMSIRDLARLETNELHMEKVVDLTDKQSRFFGLLDATDAILLIAAGDVTIGIDLTKLGDEDFVVDRETGVAHLTLPAPEVLSTRLDEEHTYVYRRSTSLLAQRNEHLESKARTEAVHAIEEAARDSAVMEKARKQAERQLKDLLEKFGIKQVIVGWRPA